MPLFELYLVTFNCARNLVNPETLAPQLFDALPQHSSSPDLIAISLQEVAPIAYAFLGGTYLSPYFDHVALTVRLAAELRGERSLYEHVATQNLGMTALMVFAKPTVAHKIQWTQSAGTGVGLWNMGNKGAAAVRIGLGLEDRDEELEMTFIAAHLAPMEWALERRNRNWEAIVRNLVFVTNDKSKQAPSERQPLLSASSNAPANESGLYTPGNYVFFAGDLNYRTSNDAPGPKAHLTYPRPVKSESSEHHFSHFLKNDQLNRELEASRTLHGFQELSITFPPTYKYSNKRFSDRPARDSGDTDDSESWPWAKHRYPSWCDRILFLPHLASSKIQPRLYSSLPLQPTSDHQPVALALGLELEPLIDDRSDSLHRNPPFPINPDWQARNAAGRRMEILVGIASYLALTKQGNAILVALAGTGFASWWIAQSLATRS